MMIMAREMFRSSHYNYLIIGHLHDPIICRLPLCLAAECVSSDRYQDCLPRPQTTVNLMKIFSLQMRKISEKYVEWLNTIDVKRF